ncbi:hypothetical protein CB0940_10320 [Cercospora beticola]|uniref:RWD domain-containing protein n=1 Tax=Cercospora beticola TaxID=122368 RepID=A0A2G5HUF0_CERBT|nr:hypothetical protein CB0940_10320 [Cercospora beticola]PIA96156.1 hypothetical protein CB0940_10320 [Cercospora beticola]WPB07030.1 hypothetical protein RHO25_011690 [Cercospora beticola]CAK1366971.1 unnamed protein product [Cercospora beticola]
MSSAERLATELELLESMYPEQVKYTEKGRELTYTSDTGSLKLRLSDGYLEDARPEVVSASIGKRDIRDQIKQRVNESEIGEEVLDAIINDFIEICETSHVNEADDQNSAASTPQPSRHAPPASSTVIIWLHHLLNTNKRKLALHPADTVCGITKPGYPGVLIYSGPAKDVQEHVNELKAQNWQAFQPRMESDEPWKFKHGRGVIEVEAMKDVVADLEEERKEGFLEAMRIK